MEQRHGHYDEGIGRPTNSAFSRPLDPQDHFIGKHKNYTYMVDSSTKLES